MPAYHMAPEAASERFDASAARIRLAQASQLSHGGRVPRPLLLAAALLLASPTAARADEDLHGPAWSGPVAPVKIADGLYYVGAANIASYLLTTPRGHVLIDSGTREMAPAILRNIEALGFRPRDVKILLAGHAHFDHVGGHAAIARATGARVYALGDDARAIATGRDRSPYAGEGWYPVVVDRVLRDGDQVSLGGVTLRAVAAPGHTPGCTVWTTRVREAGAWLAVAVHACMGPNREVRLRGNPRFPRLIADTRAAWRKLARLAPDLTLLVHPGEARTGIRGRAAWRAMIEEGRAGFEARVAAER